MACDLPLVDKDTVLAVVEGLGSAEAAAPVREGVPGIEPLCAVYLLSCLEAVREALDRGELAAHGLLEVVDGATVRLPETVFLNVNTPSDRDRASSALEPPVP